jgi:hypothetical protein
MSVWVHACCPDPAQQVHTAVANAECVRTHSGIVANVAWTPHRPPLLARFFHIFFQAGHLPGGHSWSDCSGMHA